MCSAVSQNFNLKNFWKWLGNWGNSRHFWKCLVISGNAWFPQLPATYITHIHTLSLSLYHTHTLCPSITHTPTLSLYHTHTHSLSPSITHTHVPAHTRFSSFLSSTLVGWRQRKCITWSRNVVCDSCINVTKHWHANTLDYKRLIEKNVDRKWQYIARLGSFWPNLKWLH